VNDVARELLTGNAAAAWAARAAEVDYVPAFPITPQTEIIETLARWARRGLAEARMSFGTVCKTWRFCPRCGGCPTAPAISAKPLIKMS